MTTSRLWLLAGALLALAGIFYYLSGARQVARPVEDLTVDQQANDLTVIQTDERGQVSSRTQAATLRRYVADQHIEMTQTHGQWYEQGRLVATVESGMAESYNQNQLIRLTRNVKVVQPAQKNQPAITLTTQALRAEPKINRVVTDAPVTLVSGNNEIKANQATADLNTRLYEFEQIRGQYAANPLRATPMATRLPADGATAPELVEPTVRDSLGSESARRSGSGQSDL